MKRLTAFTLVVLMGCSAPALAAASSEEAERLTTLFQGYFGSEAGVVTVTPDGDTYRAKFDFAPHLAKIADPKVTASLTPFEITLADQGGGKWKVDQDQPMSFAFKVEGAIDMKGSIGGVKGTGVFDEALRAFESSVTDMTEFAFQQTVTDKGATTNVAYTISTMHYETATTGTGDNADANVKATITNLRETVDTPAAPDGSMPPMQFSISAPTGSQETTITGLKPRPIVELAAWLVARPSPEAITAEQAELKDKLRAALPLWRNVTGTSALETMSVNTMMGLFGIDRLEMLIDMNGIVADSHLRERFAFTGLKLPEGIVPPWAAGLVPSNLTVDFKVSDFDLAAPAGIIIDNFDLSQNPPLKPELEQQLLAALLPKMAVQIGFGPSEVVSAIYHLTAEGNMTAGPVSVPSGSALVKLKGLDEIMAALQAAPPEMGMQQVAPMVVVAKGMAKQEPDGFLSWKIESTPTGSVTVNGIDPMKMGGK